MRSKHRLFAMTLAAALVLSVVAPGLAMAEEHDGDDVDDGVTELNVAVDDLTVAVTDGNDSAVANASVNVSVVDENKTYDGAGDHTTDENGTVELPAPEETVNVTVTAEKDGASTTATLEATEGEEEEDEDDSNDAFGQDVQAYLQDLLNGNGADVPMGHHVAEFVTENNPGNAPDHAGPKDDKDKPEHAGPDGERGPPDHAGPDEDRGGPDDESDDGTEDVETEEDETDDDDSDDTDDREDA